MEVCSRMYPKVIDAIVLTKVSGGDLASDATSNLFSDIYKSPPSTNPNENPNIAAQPYLFGVVGINDNGWGYGVNAVIPIGKTVDLGISIGGNSNAPINAGGFNAKIYFG